MDTAIRSRGGGEPTCGCRRSLQPVEAGDPLSTRRELLRPELFRTAPTSLSDAVCVRDGEGQNGGVIVAVTNTAIYVMAAAIIVVAIVAQFIVPRDRRRKRRPRT